MMIRRSLVLVLLGFILTLPQAYCMNNREFSADMVTTSAQGTFQGKIYFGNQKMRMETPQSIIINRMDLNVAWIIMLGQGMYMEQAINPSMMSRASTEVPGEVERLPLGQESVNGVPADKFKVTSTDASGTTSIYQWIDNQGMLVKSEAVDGSWSVTYQNIEVGPQPDFVFEVPEGYRKFSMPSMQDMMAQAQAQMNSEEN